MSDSRNARNRAWRIPLAANTCLAIALSIHNDEPSTPEPTYGTLASSNMPWIVPSSPIGPWSSGSTTVVEPGCIASASTGDADVAGPTGSSRGPIASGPEARAAIASAANCHWPSRPIPTAVIVYLAGSAARNT